jgi:hypothetical protein
MAEKEIELEGEWTVTVQYDFDPGEPEIPYYPDGSGHPGSPASVSVYAVWATLPDTSKNLVKVNVMDFLSDTGVLHIDDMEASILEDEKENYFDHED